MLRCEKKSFDKNTTRGNDWNNAMNFCTSG